MLPNWSRRQQTESQKAAPQQPPKYGIPCEGQKPLGLGEDRHAGWHCWLCLKQFLQEHPGPGASSALCSPCTSIMAEFSVEGFYGFKNLWAGDHHLLQVGETGVGMGQDLILRLQPHPCADTSQPLHLCRCLSPFLVPKLISNSLLNHFEKLLCK